MPHHLLSWLQEGVKQQVSAIRNVLAIHHKLMTDIRTILKSMAKVCMRHLIYAGLSSHHFTPYLHEVAVDGIEFSTENLCIKAT